MAIRFFINGKQRELVPVYVRLTNSRSERFICKTGMSVEPDRWSNDSETIRQRKLTDNDQRLVDNLDALKKMIDTENRFFAGHKSNLWLQGVINKFHGIKDEQSQTLNGYIDNFIKKAESGELKNKHGKNYATGTLTNYKAFQTVLNEYQGIYTDDRILELAKENKKPRPRIIIDFEDVTIDFYNSFVAYMSNEGYAINTLDKHIGTLKYFMGKSLLEKKHSCREFKENAFAGFSEDSHAIYLNDAEIEKIYRVDLSKFTPGHEKVRDAFIVLCETAVRVSDYKNVSLSIKEIPDPQKNEMVKVIEVFMKKTEKRVLIPLTVRMNELYTKYKGKFPEIADATINEYIKHIAKECKINEIVSWPTQKYGKKYVESKEKWELVTCHTGRRSAATNMRMAGMDYSDIMQITGHTTEANVKRYIRITKEQAALRLSKHEFFNKLRVAK